jgi:uncharacterized protein YwgA
MFWSGYIKCSMLYNVDEYQFKVYACYSEGLVLNVGLDVSSGNVLDWKGIWEELKEVKI